MIDKLKEKLEDDYVCARICEVFLGTKIEKHTLETLNHWLRMREFPYRALVHPTKAGEFLLDRVRS